MRKKIIKIRAEVNEMENKYYGQKSVKPKSLFLIKLLLTEVLGQKIGTVEWALLRFINSLVR